LLLLLTYFILLPNTMASDDDESDFSSEDIKRCALTKDPSSFMMVDSDNHGKDPATGSTGTRDAHSDSTSEKHSPPSGNLGSGGGPEMVSDMQPLTEDSYGGGLYGHDAANTPTSQHTCHASDFQSAEGQESDMPDRKGVHEPPSSGDRATDITGISYIQ
jgi:hypothetical protein